MGSIPEQRRWGTPKLAGLTRACTSKSRGRLPSKLAVMTEPELCVKWSSRKCLGGVIHLRQAVFPHLENADFLGASEAVLDRAKQAVLAVHIPLEIKHRVHHVLQRHGPGDAALLGDMADQEEW